MISHVLRYFKIFFYYSVVSTNPLTISSVLFFFYKISSLTKEKKLSVKLLQHVKGPSNSVIGSPEAKVEEVKACNNESKNKSNEQNTNSSATCYEVGVLPLTFFSFLY